MQKILRRVATAERVAAKRKKKYETQLFKRDKKKDSQQFKQQQEMAYLDFRRAKQAIRDEWELGPLAPKVYVGDLAARYGAISDMRFKRMARLTLAQRNARSQWAGGILRLNIAEGDRVVLLEGPDRGKIGAIDEIDLDQATVVIGGLNKSNISLPQGMKTEQGAVAINMETPIPISAVRLVHPIRDPATGVVKDVIINELVRKSIRRAAARVVPGLNIAIPWPKTEEEKPKDHACDTLRIDLEERTFVPTLLAPPMPPMLIDELRGKYSRFRTRHEPEYIAKLTAEEQAAKDRKKLRETMRTPLQELRAKERSEKKKKGKPRLTMEMLEKIGEVIAKSRARQLNATGLSSAPKAKAIDAPISPSETTEPPKTAPPS